MSGGGMGFIFAPGRKVEAQRRLQAIMSLAKRELEHALPFAMEPVVYDFAINPHGTVADWIESLPEFGLSIHLNMNGAMETSVNGQFLHLYNKHKNSLANISYGDVMEMAKSLGCPTNMGYTHDYYTGFIAEKRALDEMQSERIRFEESMRQTGVKSMVEKAQLLNQ